MAGEIADSPEMRSIVLYFSSPGGLELSRCVYKDKPGGIRRDAVRGRTSGAFRSCGSFKWTTAVRALCVLLLSSKLADSDEPDLLGAKGSLAASLDYAITKQTAWLEDLFGSDANGTLNVRRIISRTNTEMKRPGPVCLSLNGSFITPQQVQVFVDGAQVLVADQLQRLRDALLGSLENKAVIVKADFRRAA